MKKLLFTAIIMCVSMFANEYYAKLEPFKTYTVKSSVSGKVVYVNSPAESKNIKEETIVKIDSKVNEIDLKQSTIKLKSLKDILKIENSTLESYKKVSSKSKFDKDNQRVKILNMHSSIADLETKIETLKDTIENKKLVEKNKYIYDISVEVGDYVNPGTLLYTSMDLSKGKLEIFIPIEKAKGIKDKTIYLDGKKSDLKISKLESVADTKHISSYRCEIEVPSPKEFSKLVKVEFK